MRQGQQWGDPGGRRQQWLGLRCWAPDRGCFSAHRASSSASTLAPLGSWHLRILTAVSLEEGGGRRGQGTEAWALVCPRELNTHRPVLGGPICSRHFSQSPGLCLVQATSSLAWNIPQPPHGLQACIPPLDLLPTRVIFSWALF